MQNDLSTAPPTLASNLKLRAWLLRWGDLAIVLALALLPLVFFARIALVESTFYLLDVQGYFFPYHVAPVHMLAQGQAPLWNPYAFSGIPLIGDGQTALFYPPSWLFFVLPGAAALNYDILAQFSIAGVSFYLFARELRLWRAPALLGALAYMFGGFMTARVVHLSIMSGAALIPLLFFCVERALRTQSLRSFALAAVAVALQTVAGHPQIPVYTALALGLYVLVRAVERAVAGARWRALLLPLQLASIYVLGYGLAAIQLAPWVELAQQSPRAANASFDFVFSGSMFGSDWLLFLFPYLYGALERGPYAVQPMHIYTGIRVWEHLAYVGILPLALAAVGLLELLGGWRVRDARPAAVDKEPGLRDEDRTKRTTTRQYLAIPAPRYPSPGIHRWFTTLYFALLLLLSLLIAAGQHGPLADLIYATPGIGKLRAVERFVALAAFALTVLAALGVQRLVEPHGLRTRWMRLAVGVVALTTALIPYYVLALLHRPSVQSALALKPEDVQNMTLSQANAAVPLLLACASAALLAWWAWRRPGLSAAAIAVGLVLVDLATFAPHFNPTTDPQIYHTEPQVLSVFKNETEPFRKATYVTDIALDTRTAQEALAVSWGLVYGVEDINGFNSLQPRRYTDYVFGPDVEDVSYGYLLRKQLYASQSSILSSLNVKYLLAPAGVDPPITSSLTDLPASLDPLIGSNFRLIFTNERVRVYENTKAYPRAYFVDRVRLESDPRTVLATVTADGFDGRHEALVETDTLPPIAPVGATRTDSVTWVQHTPNRLILSTSTATPRFLVLSEMYFPGWRAYVDGVETPIYRTNYLFRGVEVPAGGHTVEFVYRPNSVLLGAAISLVSLALVAGLLVAERRRSRR
jgi:hypothetical protein